VAASGQACVVRNVLLRLALRTERKCINASLARLILPLGRGRPNAELTVIDHNREGRATIGARWLR